jgi:hypothetical protein
VGIFGSRDPLSPACDRQHRLDKSFAELSSQELFRKLRTLSVNTADLPSPFGSLSTSLVQQIKQKRQGETTDVEGLPSTPVEPTTAMLSPWP